jgi:dihydrodipicolinate reductase
MKKVIRLTESDLQKVIKRVIQEEEESDWWTEYGFDDKGSFLEFYYEVVEEYAYELIMEIDNEVQELLIDFFEQTGFMENVKEIVESRKKNVYGTISTIFQCW